MITTMYQTVKTMEQFEILMAELNASQVASVDTETFGDFLTGKILTVQFSIKVGTGWVVPFYNTGILFSEPSQQLWTDEQNTYIWNAIKAYLENPEKKKVGQNIKFDYQFLKYYGIRMKGIVFDTMLGNYLLNENARGQHDLGTLAKNYTDMGDYSANLPKVLGIPASKMGPLSMIKLPPEVLYEYACKDVDATLRVYCVLQPRVKQYGLLPLLQKIMLPLSVVLADMEMAGVLVDQEYYQKLAIKYETEIAKTVAELNSYPDVKWLERRQGKPVNFNSPTQMGVLFYEILKLPVYKKTKNKKKKTNAESKPSTDKEVLTRLAEEHPIPKLLLRHRKLSKFYSTYVKPMHDMVRSDGRLHTSYKQHITVTGRLASSNPNLQNIPKRDKELAMELRMGIIAPEGYTLIEADLGQIEFRLLANECKDPTMLADLSDPKMDIHKKIASVGFRIPMEQVSPDMREKAKTIVYSVLYGKGEENLAKDTGLSVEQVLAIFNAIYSRYPRLKLWMETTSRRAETTGEVIGWTGRRRRLAGGFKSGIEALMAEARRQAVNCVDHETEVLTQRGWLTVDTVRLTDYILTKDEKTGYLNWELPVQINKFPDYYGEVYEFKSKSFSAVTTPNHRWLVYNKQTKHTDCKTSDKILTHGDYRIHRTGDYGLQPTEIYSDDIVNLIGWVLTDGYFKTSKTYNCSGVGICQSQRANPNKVAIIDGILNRLQLNPYRRLVSRTQCVYWEFFGAIAAWIKNQFPKRILTPQFILRLSKRQAQMLLATMVLGDGTSDKKINKTLFYCQHKQSADMIQLLATIAGIATTVRWKDQSRYVGRSSKLQNEIRSKGVWSITLLQRKFAQVLSGQSKHSVKAISMWCPTVPSGYFVARRNGTVYVTGNSPIQGGAHDILSVASIQIKTALIKMNLESRLIMTIHDSLILEVKNEELDTVLKMVKEKMETRPGNLVVPLTVDIAVGKKLGDMAKLTKDYFEKLAVK